MIRYGELETRVNEGWPAYKKALDDAGKVYREFSYVGANHGLHNDTTPRYVREATDLAWAPTVEFFSRVMV